jgi:hypothetical protein
MPAVLLLAYGTVITLHRKVDLFRRKIEEIKSKLKVRVLILDTKHLTNTVACVFSPVLFQN